MKVILLLMKLNYELSISENIREMRRNMKNP